MRDIIGYTVTVHRGECAGKVYKYGPKNKIRARRMADKVDQEYGAIAASCNPVFGPERTAAAEYIANTADERAFWAAQ